ncbi:MAG: hypothetical protein JSV33_05055 [bacterium]|nr:MAG: hypothetical protein JSV33_05055 [bacterium]
MYADIKSTRNQIVAHFRDNRLLKGYTHDFTPKKDVFHLTVEQGQETGNTLEVKTADLKALFFVKTLEGDSSYAEKNRYEEVDTSRLIGMKIKVEFYDGEIIRGISLNYQKGKKGFFITPLDPQSNNDRIFVVADAIRNITVGDDAER